MRLFLKRKTFLEDKKRRNVHDEIASDMTLRKRAKEKYPRVNVGKLLVANETCLLKQFLKFSDECSLRSVF